MKYSRVLFVLAGILIVTCAPAQRTGTGDLCQSIPDLTPDQEQKINKLSVAHQKTMDDLRTKFWSEDDTEKAVEIKSQMNTEMEKHYKNISALLTPEQQSWYDSNCNVNNRNYYRNGGGFGRSGRLTGHPRGSGPGKGLGRGRGTGRGRGLGPGQGYGSGQGRGR